MRLSALLGLAALVIPASPAPLNTVLTETVYPSETVTIIVTAPSEIPNMPATHAKMVKNVASSFRPLRRGTSFREADYGINPNVTFAALAPVESVDTTPTSTLTGSPPTITHSRRSDDAGWEANHISADDYNGNPEPELGAASDAVTYTSVTSSAAPEPSANSGSDPALLNGLNTPDSSRPAPPNASSLSMSLANAQHTVGKTRYSSSYGAHDVLRTAFGNTQVPTSNDIEKAHNDVQKSDKKFAHAVRRRITDSASYLASRMRTAARDLFSRHAVELNTETLLPGRPDRSLNMSDPAVATKEQQSKNVALLNMDSNQPPKMNSPSKLSALNGTEHKVDGTAVNATNSA